MSGESVTFVEADLDVVDLAPESADLVFSSLALHYVRDLERLLATIAAALVPGGSVVFSVEHPIYSAPTTQTFVSTESADRVWPLDNYLVEGERVRSWFVDGVVKEHRTIATYRQWPVDAGLVIDRMEEWGPSAEAVAARPELADDRHRPWFLLLRATRPSAPGSGLGEGLGEAG